MGALFNRGNRLRGLAALTGLLLLAAYVPGLGVPARHHDFITGLAWGMGTALLLVCLLHTLRPEWLPDEADRMQQRLSRRYLREAAPGLLVYLALLILSPWLSDKPHSPWLLVAICVLPLLALGLLLRAALRYLRDADELQRKIELESLAIAALVVPQLYFSAWVLQRFGLIHVDAEPAMSWVFAGILLVRTQAGIWLRRKYQ